MNSKIYTASSLRQYNSCPKKYYYEYELLLNKYAAPLFCTDSDALSLGCAIHAGFEEWYKAGSYTESLKKFDEPIAKQAEILLNGRKYAEEFGNISKFSRIIEVEKEISAEFDGVLFAGKLDVIVKYRDELWVVDHKSSCFQLTNEEKYMNNLQLNLYIAMVRANGYKVRGMLINYIRTISLRQKQNEGIEEFWERAQQDIIDRNENYFLLLEIPRSQNEVQSIMDNIFEEIAHIQFDYEHNSFRRNPDACNEYRSLCEYHEVCAGRFREDEIAKCKYEHQELDRDFIKKLRKKEFDNPWD